MKLLKQRVHKLVGGGGGGAEPPQTTLWGAKGLDQEGLRFESLAAASDRLNASEKIDTGESCHDIKLGRNARAPEVP